MDTPARPVESFTEAQLVEAANILYERVAVACDCFPCKQDRMFADMLVYASRLVHVSTPEEVCAMGYHETDNGVCKVCGQAFTDEEIAELDRKAGL